MRELLLATNNPGKLKELQVLLSGLDIHIFTPAMLGIAADFDVAETGKTYAENAELKARAFAELAGKPTLADDSGLEIAALGNFPGIHSKRFLEGSDHERNAEILHRLENAKDRSARYIAVFCLYDPAQKTVQFFAGEVKGAMATEERGGGGFGYDPIFIPEGHTETFGELGEEVKNVLSHRARAAEKVREYFQSLEKKK